MFANRFGHNEGAICSSETGVDGVDGIAKT